LFLDWLWYIYSFICFRFILIRFRYYCNCMTFKFVWCLYFFWVFFFFIIYNKWIIWRIFSLNYIISTIITIDIADINICPWNIIICFYGSFIFIIFVFVFIICNIFILWNYINIIISFTIILDYSIYGFSSEFIIFIFFFRAFFRIRNIYNVCSVIIFLILILWYICSFSRWINYYSMIPLTNGRFSFYIIWIFLGRIRSFIIWA
jgi:hypothetical protein